jgi:Flp pilus assembly protein TadB
MFNGAMMTSFADLTAISFLFLVGCAIAYWLGVPAGRAVVILLVIFVVSLLMQWLSKRRHIKLGAYQLDYIEQQLKEPVQAKMAALNA